MNSPNHKALSGRGTWWNQNDLVGVSCEICGDIKELFADRLYCMNCQKTIEENIDILRPHIKRLKRFNKL